MGTLPTIFISYSRLDSEFAEKLNKDLQDFGVGTWIDRVEIKVGDDLINKIANAIVNNDFFCVILSENSSQSIWVKDELRQAYNEQLEHGNTKVLPVIIEPCKIPNFLNGIARADFIESYERGFEELVQSITPNPKENNQKRQLSFFYAKKAHELRKEKDKDFKQYNFYLNESLKNDTRNPEANFLKGSDLFYVGEGKKASKYFKKCLSSVDHKYKANHYLAKIEVWHGFRCAIQLLEKSIGNGDDTFEVFQMLGGLYMDLIYNCYLDNGVPKRGLRNFGKSIFDQDCKNSQKHLRRALFKSDGRSTIDKVNLLYSLSNLMLIFLNENPGYWAAYFEEYIREKEKISTPEKEDYLKIINFYGGNLYFNKAKDYAGKLFSRYPNNSDLRKDVDEFLLRVKKFMSNSQTEAKTFQGMTYESVKEDLYCSKIKYHTGAADHGVLVEKDSIFTIPLRLSDYIK